MDDIQLQLSPCPWTSAWSLPLPCNLSVNIKRQMLWMLPLILFIKVARQWMRWNWENVMKFFSQNCIHVFCQFEQEILPNLFHHEHMIHARELYAHTGNETQMIIKLYICDSMPDIAFIPRTVRCLPRACSCLPCLKDIMSLNTLNYYCPRDLQTSCFLCT